jgi:hypothetical protein
MYRGRFAHAYVVDCPTAGAVGTRRCGLGPCERSDTKHPESEVRPRRCGISFSAVGLVQGPNSYIYGPVRQGASSDQTDVFVQKDAHPCRVTASDLLGYTMRLEFATGEILCALRFT